MTIFEYFGHKLKIYDVAGFWKSDFKYAYEDTLTRFPEFSGKEIEYIDNINDESLDSMVIVKNLKNSDMKDSIRLYSVYREGYDVFYNISKNSLVNDELFNFKSRY